MDAKIEKVRDGGRVVNKALVIAHGVHETGRARDPLHRRRRPALRSRGHLDGRLGRIASMLEDAEAEILAFYAFSAAHWSKLRSTNPLLRRSAPRFWL